MKLIITILTIILLISCHEKGESDVPDDLLEKETFIGVMIDLEIMEAYYEQIHKRPQLYKTTLDSASRQLLEEKGVTELQLKRSLDYYSAMPDSLYLMYEKALDSINSMVNNNKKKD